MPVLASIHALAKPSAVKWLDTSSSLTNAFHRAENSSPKNNTVGPVIFIRKLIDVGLSLVTESIVAFLEYGAAVRLETTLEESCCRMNAVGVANDEFDRNCTTSLSDPISFAKRT